MYVITEMLVSVLEAVQMEENERATDILYSMFDENPDISKDNGCFNFESATGIAPAVEVVEWVEDTDPAVPKKIRLHHNGTEYGVFVKESEVQNV